MARAMSPSKKSPMTAVMHPSTWATVESELFFVPRGINPVELTTTKVMFRTTLVLALAVLASGCVHFANVDEVSASEGRTYVSSRTWKDGTRVVVTERVFARPEEPCDMQLIKRELFGETGVLLYRQTDMETCDVVLTRVSENYDASSEKAARITQRDLDRNGTFDVHIIDSVPYKP